MVYVQIVKFQNASIIFIFVKLYKLSPVLHQCTSRSVAFQQDLRSVSQQNFYLPLSMERLPSQQLKRNRETLEGQDQDKSGLGDLYKKAITERSRLHGFLSSLQGSVFLYLDQAQMYLEKSPPVSRLQTPLKYVVVRKFVFCLENSN